MTQVKNTIGSKGVISAHNNSVEAPFAVQRNKKEVEKIITFDESQLRDQLKTLKKQFGYIADFAAYLGVSPQFIGDCLAGRKSPGKKVLSKLGIKSRKVYDAVVIVEVDDE